MDYINNTIWKCIFKIFDPVTDNVWLVLIFCSFLFAGAMLVIRWKRGKSDVFLLPEWLFCVSAGYMIHRLPMVHDRLQLALSTVSGIILESETYQEAFKSVFSLSDLTGEKIASTLYFASTPFYPEPSVMYEHLFGTMDQIRNIPVLGEVHKACFGTATPLFVSCVVVLCIAGIFMFLKNGTRFRFVIYFFQSVVLLICTVTYGGAALCAIILWTTELFLSEALLKENTPAS